MFKKNNSSKIVLGTLLLVLAIMVGGFTFAYWASGIEGNDTSSSGEVQIGSGKVATTVVEVDDYLAEDEYLVPVGRATASSESTAVESVTLTFDVVWTSEISNTATGVEGSLKVSVDTVLIDGSATYASLVNIAGVNNYQDTAIIVDGAAVTVTLTVTLTEPSDKAAYTAIATKSIVITFDFEVTV